MHTTINWTNPLSWSIALALAILLGVQGWLILRSPSLTTGRKWLRTGLNVLLWLALAGYFLQVQWPLSRPATHALLVGDDVPASVARHLQDSLGVQERFSSRNFKAAYDSVTLAGQQFPIETLTQLSNTALQWIPYNQPDQLQTIQWKGIVRQGEMQRVTGQVQSAQKQWLRLRYGRQTLDSVSLQAGSHSFSLQFPAFARGRNEVELVLDNTTLDTLRFFARPTPPLTVQFLLNSPDFESKTLADWLGKQGHTVNVLATLSKNINSTLSINKAGKSTRNTTPDLFITEPDNANNAAVRKAVAEGKAVLFINLTSPETDVRTINRATGSRFQVRKTTNEPQIPVGNGLNALPYRFVENLAQFGVVGYPVAVQQTSGRVGISLLNETYPLALSGDSVAYSRIWTAVLARLSPPDKNNVRVDAPVFRGLQQEISINTSGVRPSTIRVGTDTVQLSQSPLNGQSFMGTLTFPTPGWQLVQDSLALYVQTLNPDNPLVNRAVVSQFMRVHAQHQFLGSLPDKVTTTQLPDWAWLLLLVGCFTALWIEPKFS